MSGVFSPQGELTHQSVTELYRQTLHWSRGDAMPDEIDLGGITRCDSSALALLLQWQHWAHDSKARLRFVNAPESLLTIARLSEVDTVLGLKHEQKQHAQAE